MTTESKGEALGLNKLLPCPFCGGNAAFVERADYTACFVQCDSPIDEYSVCMARGPLAVQDDDDEEVPGKAGAIRAWNRQAALARAGSEAPTDVGIPMSHRATIEEAAQVLESAAAHNRAKGRTVLERTQQDRADRLRLILAAQKEGASEQDAKDAAMLRLVVETGMQLHFEGRGEDDAVWVDDLMKWSDGDRLGATRALIEECAKQRAAMSAAQAQPKDTTKEKA